MSKEKRKPRGPRSRVLDRGAGWVVLVDRADCRNDRNEDECLVRARPECRFPRNGTGRLVQFLPSPEGDRVGNSTGLPSKVIPHLHYKTAQTRESVRERTVIRTVPGPGLRGILTHMLSGGGPAPRILIVDDDPNLLVLLADQLRADG